MLQRQPGVGRTDRCCRARRAGRVRCRSAVGSDRCVNWTDAAAWCAHDVTSTHALGELKRIPAYSQPDKDFCAMPSDWDPCLMPCALVALEEMERRGMLRL